MPLSDNEDAEALHLGRTRSSDDHEAMEAENEGINQCKKSTIKKPSLPNPPL